MAAQLMEAAHAQLGAVLGDALAAGDYAPLRDWLRENVWKHGRVPIFLTVSEFFRAISVLSIGNRVYSAQHITHPWLRWFSRRRLRDGVLIRATLHTG